MAMATRYYFRLVECFKSVLVLFAPLHLFDSCSYCSNTIKQGLDAAATALNYC